MGRLSPLSSAVPTFDLAALTDAGKAAGFTACGVAPCRPSGQAAALDAWLARGAHAGMRWLETTAEIRKNLHRRWPWAKSALVGVASYLAPPRDRQARGGIARHVARYAHGQDYHRTLTAWLVEWAAAIERLHGGPFRRAVLVDTGALLERELAVRAGLGWIGRNSCLIGPEGNSWTAIGVVLTALELPHSTPTVLDRCGSCTACLDACPTGAIPEPYFVDSNRCTSYLTIEHRGAIDGALAGAMGDWLFGCDVCQEVCPWNRRAMPDAAPEFAANPRYAALTLETVARMDVPAFREAFRGMPLLRPKRAGMVRNALIAGANLGDDDVRRAAAELVDDEEDAVRRAARWSLSRFD
jgi:epoxyqueuosine reductase